MINLKRNRKKTLLLCLKPITVFSEIMPIYSLWVLRSTFVGLKKMVLLKLKNSQN